MNVLTKLEATRVFLEPVMCHPLFCYTNWLQC